MIHITRQSIKIKGDIYHQRLVLNKIKLQEKKVASKEKTIHTMVTNNKLMQLSPKKLVKLHKENGLKSNMKNIPMGGMSAITPTNVQSTKNTIHTTTIE